MPKEACNTHDMKIHFNYVLIEPEELPEVTSGGLILTEKPKPNKGTIIQVGEGLPDEPIVYEVGQRVLFPINAGTEVEEEGKKYKLMRQKEILMEL